MYKKCLFYKFRQIIYPVIIEKVKSQVILPYIEQMPKNFITKRLKN